MPLPKPTLDNRVFDQLAAEGRGRVPRLAPTWTDYNASDPGITLMELMAWLAEQNIFRLDQESNEAARTFVRLVGIEPQPATTARTVACIGGSATLAERTPLGRGSTPLFETTEALFASAAQLVRVLCGGSTLADVTADNAALAAFDAFGAKPRVGAALCLGFDQALDAAGQRLSIYLWTPQWQGDDATRSALMQEAAASPCQPPPDWHLHYRVRTVWEFHAGGGIWQPLADVVDETRACSLSGFVHFSAPSGHQAGGPGPEFFIRCRIASGRFECPPQLLHIGFNAIACEHALTRAERAIGLARGQAGAEFTLGEAPIVPGSLRLRLDDGAGQVQTDWQARPGWDRAGPHDRQFRFKSETGELFTGNGLRGAIFPDGFTLYASWRAGSGSAGDIAADTLDTIPGQPSLTVAQPFAATGGGPRETLADAQARAFDLVTSVDKAVTLADIERLALATPGVPVARVRAVANMEPHLPCWTAPGVITLIVIPFCPLPAPLPSRALLDAVERYLAPRRLVTSEVHAIAPHYRQVAVSATLQLRSDADAAGVLQAATTRIDAFFDPLTGGADGLGWPFGRTVYRSELMALLADLDGVLYVTAFGLQTPSDVQPRCNNIDLCTHELVRPGKHALQTATDVPARLTRSLPHECHAHG
jgi:Baseplate J-like protein